MGHEIYYLTPSTVRARYHSGVQYLVGATPVIRPGRNS